VTLKVTAFIEGTTTDVTPEAVLVEVLRLMVVLHRVRVLEGTLTHRAHVLAHL